MGKTVLITGCSSGFGRRMVTAFLERGWTVFATLRRAEERRELFTQDAARHGERLLVRTLDITSPENRHAVAGEILRHTGALDCLVNNAGQMLLGALEDITEEQMRRQFDVNLFGALLLTTDCLPLLRTRRGVVINISSVFGIMTWPLTSMYCASKYALEGVTEALAQELHAHGVRAVLLEPGSHPGTALNENVEWGSRISVLQSSYSEQTAGYRALRRSLQERTGISVDDVALAVVRAAESRSSRLRIQVGFASRLLYRAVRWFPEWIGFRLMRIVAERAFRRANRKSRPSD